MSKKIYSEKEVAHLIRRAVELEAERPDISEGKERRGLSINEIEKIAAESGIDPELIQQAAKEFEAKKGHPKDAASDIKKESKVNKTEIVSEHWIEARPNDRVLEDLVTELNHRFGTSEDDGSWWDQLWDDYAGRAKVKKTSTSVEWSYTDEMEMYTTRVLMQRRGDKFRIRVSKRQGWNMSWYSEDTHIGLAATLTSVFTIAGGVMGITLLESPWLGILAGLALSAVAVPATLFVNKHRLKRHKIEVAEIADNLVFQTGRLIEETQYQGSGYSEKKQTGLEDIEINPSERDEQTSGRPGGLRNNLRE